MKYIIKENQAGFVVKNGRFQKMITAGTYHFPKALGYQVEIEEMEGELSYREIPYQILNRDQTFAGSVLHAEIPDGFAGFVYKNGKLAAYADCGEYTFWNVFDQYAVRAVSMEEPQMDDGVTKQMLSVLPKRLYTEMQAGEGEIGLVYYDNVLQGRYAKGIYRFWNYKHRITYQVYDMKQKQLDILGQEILTRDKIGIRMNIACMYQIRDAVEFAEKVSDLNRQLHSSAQLAIREIVGNYKLDEILESKEKISGEIYTALKEREGMFCVNFLSAGIKDIILPGEIREIMNSVLVAEKTAQASVIARREEVASTRSLLNTAKLMDENQTLCKLKVREYLEKLCGKVGVISVNGSAGILEQLGGILFGKAQ